MGLKLNENVDILNTSNVISGTLNIFGALNIKHQTWMVSKLNVFSSLIHLTGGYKKNAILFDIDCKVWNDHFS